MILEARKSYEKKNRKNEKKREEKEKKKEKNNEVMIQGKKSVLKNPGHL